MKNKVREWTCQLCGGIKPSERKPVCCGEKMLHTGWVTEQEYIRRTEGTGQAELDYY